MTIKAIDRAIYESIRLKVVAEGRLPDWRSIAGTGTTKQANYEAAKAALRATVTLIEVVSIGSFNSKDEKTLSRISINRKTQTNGSIGSAGIEEYKPNGNGTFNKVTYPDSSTDIAYEIRVITDKTADERLCGTIINKALGRRKALTMFNDDFTPNTDYFLIEFTGSVDVSNESFREVIYNYTVRDVFIDETNELSTVVPLTTITTHIKGDNDLDFSTITTN